MSNGKAFRLFISTAGTATTPLVEVEMQGDLNIRTGKTINRQAFKNGALSSHGNDGFSADFQMGLVEPTPAGQTEIWDASDAETPVYIEIKSAATGTMRFKGPVKLAVTEIPNPIDGPRVATVEISEDGNITRDVTT